MSINAMHCAHRCDGSLHRCSSTRTGIRNARDGVHTGDAYYNITVTGALACFMHAYRVRQDGWQT